MELKDTKIFCKYEVYGFIKGEAYTICLCKEKNIAEYICLAYADNDPNGETYFYTNIVIDSKTDNCCIGFKKNKNGKIERVEIN